MPIPLLFSSYVILFQGGISALYSVSYGGLYLDCQYYIFRGPSLVAVHVTVLEGSHA